MRRSPKWWIVPLRQNFALFSAACMTASCLAAYLGWQTITAGSQSSEDRIKGRNRPSPQEIRKHGNDVDHHPYNLSNMERAPYADSANPSVHHHDVVDKKQAQRLQAMVENALESSWEENLSNAVTAHERFMLPGTWATRSQHPGQDDATALLQKINAKHDELIKKQQQVQKQQNEEAKSNDKIQFWK